MVITQYPSGKLSKGIQVLLCRIPYIDFFIDPLQFFSWYHRKEGLLKFFWKDKRNGSHFNISGALRQSL